MPRARTGDFIIGLNIELGRGGTALGDADWDTEFRPILVYTRGPLMLALNPIFGWAVTGDREAAPDFEPAAKLRVDTGLGVGVGLEHYAGFGLVTEPLPRGEQTHVLYVIADLVDAAFDLNVGIGRSLTDAIDPWTLKMIAGLGF